MLTYLKPGDRYQANDIYEHFRHNISSPRVVGVTLEESHDHGTSVKPGDLVNEEQCRHHLPRRWTPDEE